MAVTTTDCLLKVNKSIDSLQDAEIAAVSVVKNVALHNVDPDAHIGMIAEKVASEIDSELADAASQLGVSIKNRVEKIVADKIAAGEITGGGTKPDDPKPPVTIEVPQPTVTLPASIVYGESVTLSITKGDGEVYDIVKFWVKVGEAEEVSVVCVEGAGSYTFTAPSEGDAVSVLVSAEDTEGNRGKNRAANAVLVPGRIARPTITSPVSGAEVYYATGIALVSSDFVVEAGTATHESTDWLITGPDNAVIANALGSSDLTAHTFTGLTLDDGKTYYASVQHNGSGGIKSEFSVVSPFVAKNAIEVIEGRYIYRHPTEPGSVIQFYDVGTASNVSLLVYDAVKRKASLKWDIRTSNLPDSTLPNLNQPNTNSTWFINGSTTAVAQSTASRLTEAQLNTLWPASIIDPNTAKYNCDVWAGMGISNFPALQYVRSVMSADGKYADIPNIQ